jgi:hypothetical protein
VALEPWLRAIESLSERIKYEGSWLPDIRAPSLRRTVLSYATKHNDSATLASGANESR